MMGCQGRTFVFTPISHRVRLDEMMILVYNEIGDRVVIE